MTDIALQWIDGEADVLLDGADLLADDGLETAVVISLFCDARADVSDALPEGDKTRRGWWGDQFGATGDRTGSKLWLLWREKRTSETLERARRYCEESLAWMIDDGVAASLAVTTSFASLADLTASGAKPDEYALVIELQIIKPDGSQVAFRYAYQWDQQLYRKV